MKKSLIIFFVSSLIFPSLVHSAWFKLFSTQTADLYLDTSSIKREKTSIFFSQLVNYKVKQKNGMLSLKTISEINCNDLSIRDLDFFSWVSSRFGAFFIYCTGTGKKIFTLLHLPSHPPLRDLMWSSVKLIF